MKISVDGILGSAKKINDRRQLEEEDPNKKKQEVRSDSITITRKVNSRLDKIEVELREIQSSLSKSQVINDGIKRLQGDIQKGGTNIKDIINSVNYEGRNILTAYVGEEINEKILEVKSARLNSEISRDTGKLKRLQVEVDNIMASNLAGQEKVETIMENINSIFDNWGPGTIERLSNLKVDSVMRLIK